MAKRKPAKKAKKKLSSFASALKKTTKKKKIGLKGKTKKNKRPDVSLWDLDRDGITYSAMSKFLNCRERFRLRYVEGWKPKTINYALEFGNVFHLFVEAQERGIDMERMIDIGKNYISQRELQADAEQIRELSMMVKVAHVTFKHYVSYWEQNACFQHRNKWYYDKDFDWIAKEKPFDIQYTMPHGRKVKLRGMMDGHFQVNRKVQGHWLFETKTKGQIDAEGITAGLKKDMQTGLYLTALQQQTGQIPKGFLYNVIRRSSLKPRGGRGNAQAGRDTPETYAARVEEDIMKRPEWYFMRWVTKIDKDDLINFQQRQLNPILYQICQWWDSVKKNPFEPYMTKIHCPSCNDYVMRNDMPVPKSQSNKHECEGTGFITIPNPEHYERPFGCYDGMANSQRGDYFSILTQDNYFNYEQSKFSFPELDDHSDDLNNYTQGIYGKEECPF